MVNSTCPSVNTIQVDQTSFWTHGAMDWDTHRIGWAISGGCAVLTCFITLFTVFGHARHYTVPAEQRQIIRILYMPPIFAIISFFSYRFFRSYTYYSLAEVIYEAFTISAFLLLIIQFVAATSSGKTAESALVRKDKQPLPFPFCFWRYRPTKAYFMYTLKWSVLQYVIVKPAVSIAGIITEALGVLCESSYSPHFASVYLDSIDFVCISVALYGLWVFYSLTKEELQGRRPFAKFLCIKLIVFLTFYQEFLFSVLQSHGVIKGTEFWTATNVADGLNALTTTIEMVLFALLMAWAYPNTEYKAKSEETTNVFKPLWDSINFSDFVVEIYLSLKFFVDYARKKPGTHTTKHLKPYSVDFDDAFGLHPGTQSSSFDNTHAKLAKAGAIPAGGAGQASNRSPPGERDLEADGSGTDNEGDASKPFLFARRGGNGNGASSPAADEPHSARPLARGASASGDEYGQAM